MGYQSEAELENKLIEKLKTQGYERVLINDYAELENNFREQLNKFNIIALENKPLTDKEFERVLNVLNGKSVLQSAIKLREKIDFDREDGTKIYLKLLSENAEDNIYQVSNQITVQGKYKNRYDVTILINGLPLVQIELKRSGIDINEAINQIDRYRIHSYRGLFHYIQIYVVSNSVETRYFANTDAQRLLKSLTFYWTTETNERINKLEDFSSSFFNKARLLKNVIRYMVINETDKNLIVMRPYQIYATEALIRHALDTGKNGYIWHTTGSGKTLTSWKCANLLSKEQSIKKVFFLIDRKDLDIQTKEEFNKFEKDCVDETDKTETLVKQIKDIDRKLIVTTIQKMANAVKNPKYSKILDKYKEEKVIFIIDECHRSQFGEMHTTIKHHFKRAQYFGFTGTPRFEENKSQNGLKTSDLFEKCLHTYLIKNAIYDHNVLGFSIEYIQTFKGQYDENDKTMVEGIDTDEVYMADERIDLVTNHIINNHKCKTVNGKYTAIFATSSIPALAKYYDKIKSLNSDLKIAAVFSYGENEDLEGKDEHSKDILARIIDDYNKEFDTNFSLETFAAYNKDITNRLKIKKSPKIDILLVVNMYLTGFDSRPLNTLYVDKNLEWHNLVQAFSRTNRVEMASKPFGNIICYRNLKSNTDKALRLFSNELEANTDNNPPIWIIPGYGYFRDKFKELAFKLLSIAPTVQSVDDLMSEDAQREFVIAFRELSKIKSILTTFSEFSWADVEDALTCQGYEDYKSRYLTLYDFVKKERNAEKVSILDDIDFAIEVIQTDKINVTYIMNLLRNVDTANKKQQAKDLEHIKQELDRTDNPELRRKVDLIRAFIDRVMPTIKQNDSIDEAYANFESEQRNKEIEEFANKQEINAEFLKQTISDYEFSNTINKKDIITGIDRPIKFKEKHELVAKIIQFIKENVFKYQ